MKFRRHVLPDAVRARDHGEHRGGLRSAERSICREFRDVVFEDVVFDNTSSVTPY